MISLKRVRASSLATSEIGELVRGHAAAHSNVNSATLQQDVEQGELVRQTNGLPPRRDDDRRSHVDAFGAPCEVRQPLQRVSVQRVRRAVVLWSPERVEPQGFNHVADLHQLLNELVVGTPWRSRDSPRTRSQSSKLLHPGKTPTRTKVLVPTLEQLLDALDGAVHLDVAVVYEVQREECDHMALLTPNNLAMCSARRSASG